MGGLVGGLVFGGRADQRNRRFVRNRQAFTGRFAKTEISRKASLAQCFARMAWKLLKNKKHAHYRACFYP